MNGTREVYAILFIEGHTSQEQAFAVISLCMSQCNDCRGRASTKALLIYLDKGTIPLRDNGGTTTIDGLTYHAYLPNQRLDRNDRMAE